MKPEALTREFQTPYALVVFPSTEHRSALLRTIAQAGMVPLLCGSPDEVREAMKRENIQVVVCEDLLPEKALRVILLRARNYAKPIPVIVTSRTGEWEEFLKALRLGAFDYLVLPPRLDEVRRVLGLALAEGRRRDGGETSYAGTTVPEGDPLASHFDDRWVNRFKQAAAVLSRPLTLRTQLPKTN